jgi:hypothetical protein
MRATPRLRGLPVFGFAVAGLLLGHGLAYLLAVPDSYHRSFVLQRTGHDYLPAAGEAALILLLAGAAAVVARAWMGRDRAETEGFASLAGLLALIQVVAFAGQEVLERLVSGSPLGELVHDHVLATGLIVQVAVALVGATLLRLLARASARIATAGVARVPPPRPALATSPLAAADPLLGRVAPSARNVRAPPSA